MYLQHDSVVLEEPQNSFSCYTPTVTEEEADVVHLKYNNKENSVCVDFSDEKDTPMINKKSHI